MDLPIRHDGRTGDTACFYGLRSPSVSTDGANIVPGGLKGRGALGEPGRRKHWIERTQ